MNENSMEIKATKPAETKTATGDTVTDTAGKPVLQPIAMETKPTEPSFQENLRKLMKESGFSDEAIEGSLGKIEAEVVGAEKKTAKAKLEALRAEDTEKLKKVHSDLLAAIAPIIEASGIKMDFPGKQIVYHVGEAGGICFDLAYPEPLPDTTKKPKGNGGIKVRKAVVMGVVHLRIPELSINMKVAESLSAWYKMWTGHENHGFASATAAVLNIGDGSEGKSGQDGVFNVQNVPAIPETATTAGSKAYNIVTLKDKGYTFFNITKGKVQMPKLPVAAPTAPVAVAEAPKAVETAVATAPATPAPVATAPVASSLPENWNQMSKADKKAWRAKQGKVVSS